MKDTQTVPAPIAAIKELRDKIFALSPIELGLHADEGKSAIWGILMEMGYAPGLASLVVLADGTTSFFLGHGGGITSAGKHEKVRAAAEIFLNTAEGHLGQMQETDSYPYPEADQVKFYLLTFYGKFTAEAAETELIEKTHTLSDLFHAGQQVLTEIRLIQE